eukprot:Hpha_TRINITY_DN15774_c2_g1::TRINITY_DN15774_c2_g1_i1::g.40586::m.40586/K11838/USP7, UBP15; ubiquitin carboxyl-terminal hydrolase 7
MSSYPSHGASYSSYSGGLGSSYTGGNYSSSTYTSRYASPPSYCCGLQNQGATCYLNGLLQSLFHLSYFRASIYGLPTDDEDSDGHQKMCAALQRLFYNMETGGRSCSTRELTQSFGWTGGEAFVQQDVQELLMVFVFGALDTLCSRASSSTNMIKDLFEGKREIFVQIVSGPKDGWKGPRRSEPFCDLQLDIRTREGTLGDIAESLKYMLRPENLTGENKYCYEDPETKETSYHDAQRQEVLSQLPKVLIFHLRRFKRDDRYDRMEKVTDRFVFPPELDMGDFVDPAVNGEQCRHYDLHAVMVHSGRDASFGHYYSFVRLRGEESEEGERKRKWYKFDDSVVSSATEKDAIDDNFGGNSGDYGLSSSRTAYLLIYVRKDIADSLVYRPRDGERPARLLEREKMKTEGHLYCVFTLLLPTDIATDLTAKEILQGRRIPPAVPRELVKSLPADRKLNFFREDKPAAVVDGVIKALKRDDRPVLWIFDEGRPMQLLSEDSSNTLDRILDPSYTSRGRVLERWILVDTTAATQITPAPARSATFLFLKEYVAQQEVLRHHGVTTLRLGQDTCETLNACLSADDQRAFVVWWRALPKGGVALLPEEKPLLELVSGEVLVFQRVESEAAAAWLRRDQNETGGRTYRSGSFAADAAQVPHELAHTVFPSPAELMEGRVVSFNPRRPRPSEKDGGRVEVLAVDSWRASRLQKALADRLGEVDPKRICLWRGTDLRLLAPDDTLLQAIQGSPAVARRSPRNSEENWRLLYEVTDLPANELQHRHVLWAEARGRGHVPLGKPGYLLLPDTKHLRMEEVLMVACKQWPGLGSDPRKVQMVEISDRQIVPKPGSLYSSTKQWSWTSTDMRYRSKHGDWRWLEDSTYRFEPLVEAKDGKQVHQVLRWKCEADGKVSLNEEPFLLSIRLTDTTEYIRKRIEMAIAEACLPKPPPKQTPPAPTKRPSLTTPEPPESAVSPERLRSPAHGHSGAMDDREEQRLIEAALTASLSPQHLSPQRGEPEAGSDPWVPSVLFRTLERDPWGVESIGDGEQVGAVLEHRRYDSAVALGVSTPADVKGVSSRPSTYRPASRNGVGVVIDPSKGLKASRGGSYNYSY